MKDLDLTLDYMENARFNYIYGPQIVHLNVPFSTTEKLCLTMVYHKFVLRNGPRAKFMTALQLSNLIQLMFKITNVYIRQRIVYCVCHESDCTDPSYTADKHCTLGSFMQMFTIYFSKDLDKRMQFAFKVYDEKNLGYLSREQVMRFIENFFVGDDEDEIFELRTDMLEILFAKFDSDKDLNITYEEYCETVRKQPALLEFLGVVFPSMTQLTTVAHIVNQVERGLF